MPRLLIDRESQGFVYPTKQEMEKRLLVAHKQSETEPEVENEDNKLVQLASVSSPGDFAEKLLEVVRQSPDPVGVAERLLNLVRKDSLLRVK